ncbi:MAG: tungstate ABC transporter substrate-binding protein WtpA [Bacteroidetes bacterium HGW-Bacteroidetes-11]|jgi:molybdate/tungstate transport system substrate-binding protein|nr:MAG: tungstate ABC transporter substrate-binding protein WtpA [Bacteroidetes bacterium HGW-Bacteroidetes-11]
MIKSGLKIAVAFMAALALASCGRLNDTGSQSDLKGNLIIFHAGSLSVPFRALADSFTKIHPAVNILPESAGSLASIRKITDLNRPCDIMASADYILIDKLMIPDFASWNLLFAGNEMAIVYHPGSRMSDSINENNWFKILQNPDVRFGRSDPNSDPCGYRAILTMKLSEKFYKMPGLTDDLMRKDQKYIRPKEVDLLALLETGTLDYIFLYKSVAIQHKLPYLSLPDSINLSSPELQDFYKTVSVDVAGNKPGEKITQYGEAMVYGLTIPYKSENPEIAEAFVKFIIEKGLPIIEAMGQKLIEPEFSPKSTSIPDFMN